MKTYNFKTLSKTFVMGDINGDFKSLHSLIKRNSSLKEDLIEYAVKIKETLNSKKKKTRQPNTTFNDAVLISTGNCYFGINDFNETKNTLEEMNTYLMNINSVLILLRGNNDDPSFFNENKINFSNIIAIPDYSIIQVNNENILCVGGGISIDREWRKNQEQLLGNFDKHTKLYWEDEYLLYSEENLNEIKDSGFEINYVVSHSTNSLEKTLKNFEEFEEWVKTDTNLLKDISNNDKTLELIYNYIMANNMSLKKWYFGGNSNLTITQSKEYIPYIGLDRFYNFKNIEETHAFSSWAATKKSISPYDFDFNIDNNEPLEGIEAPHYEEPQPIHAENQRVRPNFLGELRNALRR